MSMYIDIVATMNNKVRICRRERVASHDDVLAVVARVGSAASDTFQSDVDTVTVCQCSQERFEKIQTRAVHFTNICGKIRHWRVAHTINPAVQPLVVRVDNNFGRFSALYGPKCNLLTTHTNTVTIFRAARSSRDIAEAIEHALTPEGIMESTVHMIVASARVSHPICMQCDYIDMVLFNDARWTARTVVKTEEGAHMKSICLSRVSAAWVASLGTGLRVPTRVLLNVTKNGGVNVFLSVDDIFCEDVEHKYLPIYEAIVAIVERYT